MSCSLSRDANPAASQSFLDQFTTRPKQQAVKPQFGTEHPCAESGCNLSRSWWPRCEFTDQKAALNFVWPPHTAAPWITGNKLQSSTLEHPRPACSVEPELQADPSGSKQSNSARMEGAQSKDDTGCVCLIPSSRQGDVKQRGVPSTGLPFVRALGVCIHQAAPARKAAPWPQHPELLGIKPSTAPTLSAGLATAQPCKIFSTQTI